MNRTHYITCIILAICVSIIGCSPKANVEEEVKPSKVLVYNDAKECIGEIIYDDYGNATKTLLESGDTSEDSTTEYVYDKSGNILKKHYQSANDTYTEEHEYDRSGNISKTSYHREHSDFTLNYVTEFEYDKYGNVTLRKQTEDSKEPTITEYKYTYENEQIKTCETITDGKVISITEYTYNTNGNITKSHNSLSDGKVIHIIEHEYDTHNNPTKKTTSIIVDSTEQIMVLEYDNTYNAEDNLSRTTQYAIENGQRQFAAEYEYIYE